VSKPTPPGDKTLIEGSPSNSIATKAGAKSMFGKKGHKPEKGKKVGAKHGPYGAKKM
jgi:hypothetical protein